MIKIYTDRTHITNNRKYLSDLLRPLIPNKNLKKYGLEDDEVKLVNDIESCDVILLPLSWNYYLKYNKKREADNFIKKANLINKKILIWFTGDYFCLKKSNNIISIRQSCYKSMEIENEFALPVFINDPFQNLRINKIKHSKKLEKPSIGFCGQVDNSLIRTFFKSILRFQKNIKYYLGYSHWYPEKIIPPTYYRKIVLDQIENNKQIDTQFIRRKFYHGRDINEKEAKKAFLNNILKTNYTICIRGTGNFSKRFYETLALGRIPIYVNLDSKLPFQDIINWKQHVVWVESYEIPNIVNKVLSFHNALTKEEFIELQESNRILWQQYLSFSGFYKKLIYHVKDII
tara:strand:- start:428 stop:1462 length:1035 start_codon:yes stop_codon:yes gene_type:complete